MERLPDEVLLMIFSGFNPVELVRLELVCKRLKNFFRSNESLSRDASYLDENSKLSFDKINLRLINVFFRCGSNLTSLGISLPFSWEFQSRIDIFCAFLPKVKLKHLWIDLWTHVEDGPTELYCPWTCERMKDRESSKLLQLGTSSICEAILQCSNLESLCLRSSKRDQIFVVPKGRYNSRFLAKCKLTKLVLDGFDVDNLFSDECNLLKVLSRAQVIIFEKCFGLEPENVFNLLWTAKYTIKEFSCNTGMLCEVISTSLIGEITMPKLNALKVGFYTDDGGDGYNLFPTFKCPNLSHLEIFQDAPIKFLIDLLRSSAIDTLVILDSNLWFIFPKDILQLCKKVRRLEIFGGYGETFIDRLKTVILSFQVEELVLKDCFLTSGKVLIELIETLQKDSSSTVISRLEIIEGENEITDESLDWLKGNVEHFKYSTENYKGKLQEFVTASEDKQDSYFLQHRDRMG